MAKEMPTEPEGVESSGSTAPVDPKLAQRMEKKAAKRAAREQKKATQAAMGGNKPWFVPLMLGLMLFGLVWVVVFYLSQGKWPVASIGNWNLAVGFAFIMAGFLMTTQWK